MSTVPDSDYLHPFTDLCHMQICVFVPAVNVKNTFFFFQRLPADKSLYRFVINVGLDSPIYFL